MVFCAAGDSFRTPVGAALGLVTSARRHLAYLQLSPLDQRRTGVALDS